MAEFDTATSSELLVAKRVEEYCKENNLDILREDRDKAIRWLLDGNFVDLGGLVALRGFIYQYYVTIYYLAEMMNDGCRWDTVALELIDDITLLGNDFVRYVQVKTVREEGVLRISQGSLYKRDNGLNSWLDKLFKNLNYTSNHLSNDDALQQATIQFEIATNSPFYDQDALNVYLSNEDYSCTVPTDNDIFIHLMSVHKIKVRGKGTFEARLDAHLPKDISWCLERFRFHRFGTLLNLQQNIVDKLKGLLRTQEEMLKDAIVPYIFQRLLSFLVSRTHRDDDSYDRSKLVIGETEFRELFHELEQSGENAIKEATDRDSLKSVFEGCFRDVGDRIAREWSHSLHKDELIQTLHWIKEQLEYKVQTNEDVYIYHRFLNRLFRISNSQVYFDMDRSEDKVYLSDSLMHMTFYLVFYKERSLDQDKDILVKFGHYGDEARHLFGIHNARRREEFDYVMRKLADKVLTNKLFNPDDACYIFLTHLKPESSHDGTGNPFAALTRISKPPRDNSDVKQQVKVTDKPENIRFFQEQFLTDFIYGSQGMDEVSFRSSDVQAIWHGRLLEGEKKA